MVCIGKCVSLGVGTYLTTTFFFQLSVLGQAWASLDFNLDAQPCLILGYSLCKGWLNLSAFSILKVWKAPGADMVYIGKCVSFGFGL